MSVLHILTIAALDWRNGHEYALQAMAELRRRNVEFEYELVGDGPFLEAVAFARHELGLEDAVRMIQRLSPRKVKDYSRRVDVYLLAAVAGEASIDFRPDGWSGKPIVCSDLPGLAERFSQYHSVHVFPRRDSAALADILAGLSAPGGVQPSGRSLAG